MTTRPKVCIDKVLPRDLMRQQPTTRSGGRPRAIAPIGKTWMNGSRLQVRFMGGTSAQKNTAREQAGWWSQHANLTFDFNDAPGADIRITFDPQLGAWSYVGTDCKGIPLNQATMNLGFLDGGTTAHEFGHAIGLAHEHNRPDTPETCDESRQGTNGDRAVGSWDVNSVMNYCNPVYNNGGNLSSGDVRGIATMYGE